MIFSSSKIRKNKQWIIITAFLVSFTTLLSGIFITYNDHVARENLHQSEYHKQMVLSMRTKRQPTPLPISPTPTITHATISPMPTLSASPSPVPSVAPAPIRFGVVVDDYANNQGTLDTLTSQLSHPLSSISIYKQFGLDGNKDIDQSALAYAKSHNMTVYIAWEPWNPDQGMSQAIDYLQQINSGAEDAYITDFGHSLQTYGGPVVLRFGHEMNGNWYPWGNRPSDYVAAYRHIVTQLRNLGVSNVKYMWCINSENVPDSPISTAAQFYPGGDMVDVIGIDGYNWGSTNSTGWRSFSQIFSAAYHFVQQYNKPIVIPETASTEMGGDKSAWVRDMFSSLPATFPFVREVVWFDLLKETDWRINSSLSSQQAFVASLKQP